MALVTDPFLLSEPLYSKVPIEIKFLSLFLFSPVKELKNGERAVDRFAIFLLDQGTSDY